MDVHRPDTRVVEPPESVRRVWIDCSETYRAGCHSGIQRVVRNLVHFGQCEREFACRPVVHAAHDWFAPDWDPVAHGSRTGRHNPDEVGIGDRLANACRRALKRSRKAVVPSRIAARVAEWNRWIRWRRTHERAEFRPGDILLLPDTTWNYCVAPDYAALRRAGVKVGFMIHDIIAITHPQFFVPRVAQNFSRWFAATIPQVDFVIAGSRTVRDTICNYVREYLPAAGLSPAAFDWCWYGVSIDQVRANGAVRAEVQRAFAADSTVEVLAGTHDARPYLMVSTLEPRKNFPLLIDAFERVWQRRPEARLCLVGRQGWLVDALVERIRRHPQFGRRLFWFADLSDTELAYAYRHSKVFLFPSFVEGFGLPIVEALQHGLPVFASDTAIHREVAGEHAAYFHPHSPDSLSQLIERYERGERFQGVCEPAGYRPMEWPESTRMLLKKCRILADLASASATDVSPDPRSAGRPGSRSESASERLAPALWPAMKPAVARCVDSC